MASAAKKAEQAETILLDPKGIKVGWRARQDYGDLTELADSIKKVGQLQPIVVRKGKSGYIIIAGLRRTRACRLIGIKVRAVVISPKDEEENLLAQLHENVKRKNFDRLEVGEGLKRYRGIYEKAHPETKHGAAGKGRGKGIDAAERFTKVAAKELSVSEQVVRDLLDIAGLPEEEKAKIDGAKTTSQRNRAALSAVSKVRKKRREKKLQAKVKAKQAERAKDAGKPGKKRIKKEKHPIYLVPGRYEDFIADRGAIPKSGFDLILTDPSYALKRSTLYHSTRTSIAEEVDWDKLDIGWVKRCAEFLAKQGSILAFCPLEVIGEYKAVFLELGLSYRGAMAWHKTNPAPAHRNVYIPSLEGIVWASRGKTGYYFPEWDNAGGREAHNLIEGPICQGEERLDHPTQKPLWLIKRLMDRHSAPGDVVWDPFVGTGTTLVACKKMGRAGYGNESRKGYIKMAVARLGAL